MGTDLHAWEVHLKSHLENTQMCLACGSCTEMVRPYEEATIIQREEIASHPGHPSKDMLPTLLLLLPQRSRPGAEEGERKCLQTMPHTVH